MCARGISNAMYAYACVPDEFVWLQVNSLFSISIIATWPPPAETVSGEPMFCFGTPEKESLTLGTAPATHMYVYVCMHACTHTHTHIYTYNVVKIAA